MLARRIQALALTAAIVAGLRSEAHAQTTVYGQGAAGITYTDNLFNAASRPVPERPGRQDAWYVTLVPGLGLTHQAQRSRYLLAYSHSFIHYLTAIDAQAHGDTGLVQGTYELTPVDSLTVGITASRTSTAFLLAESSSLGQPEPDTTATFLAGTVRQSLQHQYSPNWAGYESTSFGVMRTVGAVGPEPLRFALSWALGATYSLERDAWSLEWMTTYFHSLAAEENGVRVPRARYVQSGPVASWRRDLSAEWASELRAGFAVGRSLDEGGPLGLVPSFGGALQWRRDPYGATLAYSAQATANLYTNRVYYSDTVSLTGTWGVIPEHNIALTSSHAISANRPLVTPGVDTEPTVFAWISNAGLTWAPERLPWASLTYQHTEQFGARDSATVASFYRNQVTLTAGWRFPPVDTSRIARDRPFRVDGADQEEPRPSSTEDRDSGDGARPSDESGSSGAGTRAP